MKANPLFIFIGLSESLILSMLHIFIFSWVPTIKKVKDDPSTSNIFTTLMMAMMVGGGFFRVLFNVYKKSFNVSKIISFITMLSMFIISYTNNYNNIVIGYILFEIAIGMFYPTFSKIKSECLPKEYRGTLMNIFKIPFNVINILLFISTDKIFSLESFWKISFAVGVINLLIQLLFLTEKDNKEAKIKIN